MTEPAQFHPWLQPKGFLEPAQFHPWLQPKGFLEPYQGDVRDASALRSPYPCDLEELAKYFVWSPVRRRLFNALLTYRTRLKALGVNHGFHWIDGSFLEHCEVSRKNDPHDLDLVTWIPVADMEAFRTIRAKLPSRAVIKAELQLDTFFAPCTKDGWLEPQNAIYWLGLFGHTRNGDWKGIVQIDLAHDEAGCILEGEVP